MNIAISRFLYSESSYKSCKNILKKALVLTDSPALISKILHNLAVMNYYEIKAHNNQFIEEKVL